MDRTNPRLLADLRKKLARPGEPPVSNQAVQQRRARLQAIVPMPTDIATYIVAQRVGMKLHSYLDEAKLDQVATWEQRLSAKEANMGAVASAPTPVRRPATRPAIVKELHLDRIKVPDAALSSRRKAEAERMAVVYPTFYAFENSVREFVDGHLMAEYGKDWWDDPKVVSKPVRDTVERDRTAGGSYPDNRPRKARPIYYTNLGDLVLITASEKGWSVFKPPMFPSDKWFPALVERVEASRNILAHMNPLQKRDIDRLRMDVEDWIAQIKDREPALVP
jgi:hypothetical protein